jgi:hypothetical protein
VIAAAPSAHGGDPGSPVLVRFTHHALVRFQERVRPGLSAEAAAAALAALVPFAEFVEGSDGDGPDRAWMMVGDLAFPLARRPDATLVALTCLTPAETKQAGERARAAAIRQADRYRTRCARRGWMAA